MSAANRPAATAARSSGKPRYMDLTQPISTGIFHSRIYPEPKLTKLSTLETDGVNVTHASFAVHTGTHVDAPSHFLSDGETITDIEVSRFVGRGLLASVQRGPREEIPLSDLATILQAADRNTVLLLRTGWDSRFDNAENYRQYPYLSIELAHAIVEAGVRMIAMDTPSPDLPEGGRPVGFDWPVHKILMRGDVLIAEQLQGLGQLVGVDDFVVRAMPIALAGSDGAPARIVAEVPV